VQLWWQQFLSIFLRIYVIFCTKTSLTSYGVTLPSVLCRPTIDASGNDIAKSINCRTLKVWWTTRTFLFLVSLLSFCFRIVRWTSATSVNNYSEFIVKQIKNCSWVQLLTGRRPMGSFCPGAVATIARWKSAPMLFYVHRHRHIMDLQSINQGFYSGLSNPEPKNVPGGTDVLGKWKSVPGKVRIRASIFTSIFMLF